MTRLRLFEIRLAITATILFLVFGMVRLLWYPGGYFAISGVAYLLLILAAVAVAIGPGLSTFVFKPGKWGLKMDLWLLAGVEAVVIGVAVAVIYARQPFYTVFAVDRFEAVMRSEVDAGQITDERLLVRPGHEPRLVYAELPQDPERLSQLTEETLFQGKADIDRRPEFWKPYPAGIPALKSAAKPLDALLDAGDERASAIVRWLSRHGGQADDFLYLPLRGQRRDAVAIVDADIGYPVAVVDVDPW